MQRMCHIEFASVPAQCRGDARGNGSILPRRDEIRIAGKSFDLVSNNYFNFCRDFLDSCLAQSVFFRSINAFCPNKTSLVLCPVCESPTCHRSHTATAHGATASTPNLLGDPYSPPPSTKNTIKYLPSSLSSPLMRPQRLPHHRFRTRGMSRRRLFLPRLSEKSASLLNNNYACDAKTRSTTTMRLSMFEDPEAKHQLSYQLGAYS